MATEFKQYYAVFHLLPIREYSLKTAIGILPVFDTLEDAADYNNLNGGQLQIVAFSFNNGASDDEPDNT